MTTRPRHIAHLYLHAVLDEGQYADVLDLLAGITPHIQAFAPDAVQLDLTSALRYFDLDPYGLVQLAKLRLVALYGIDSSVGLAGNRMLAAMAAAASAPRRTTQIPSDQAATDAWLRPRPVTALPGIGPATATTLSSYGLHTIGQVADVPAAILQRVLGVAPARLLAERARGHDSRPVTAKEPAAHMTADLILDRDCLDPEQRHRAVLALAEQLGQRLRSESRVTGRVTLTVRYADRSSTIRTSTLAEPTAHSPVLASTALGLLAALGLQRARVRAFAIRIDDLQPASDAHHQLSLDPGDDRARAAEAAADCARRRFGPDAVHSATLVRQRAVLGPAAGKPPQARALRGATSDPREDRQSAPPGRGTVPEGRAVSRGGAAG
jgi:DNA polymerase IV